MEKRIWLSDLWDYGRSILIDNIHIFSILMLNYADFQCGILKTVKIKLFLFNIWFIHGKNKLNLTEDKPRKISSCQPLIKVNFFHFICACNRFGSIWDRIVFFLSEQSNELKALNSLCLSQIGNVKSVRG